MKLKKLLSVLLTFATVISMFSLFSVSASARSTAYVTLSIEPRGSGVARFNNGEWGSYIGQRFFIEEETIQIEAKPEAGYKFVRWGAPANSTQNPYRLTGLSDKGNYTITAYFEEIPEPEYNITVTNGIAEDYGVWTTATKAVAGRKISITAAPAPQSGMVFDTWVVKSGNVTLANANETTTTFTMPATAVSVEATYKQSDPNAGKKVSLYFIQGDKYGKGEYELQVAYGTTFEFPPNPFGTLKGYEFTGWHEAETSKTYKPGDKAVATETTYYVADYKSLPVTVHFEIYDNRTASGTMADVQVERGSIFTLPECTFTANKGYVFDEWMMYGGAGSKVEIKNDITIWAKFKEDPNYSRYCIITFDNGYTGSKHDTYTDKAVKNSTYRLPKNSFTRPETGVIFSCWDMGEVGKTVEIGDENELTITAVWKKKVDLSDCIVTVYQGNLDDDAALYENYIYCGYPIEPVFDIRTKDGTILKEGTDYTASFSNNIGAGEKALITAKGIGCYSGTVKKYFTVYKLALQYEMQKNGEKFPVLNPDINIGVKSSYDYTGQQIMPEINVTYKKEGTVYAIPNSNFIIKCKKSVDPGEYVVNYKANGKNVTCIDEFVDRYFIKPPKSAISVKNKGNGVIKVSFTKLTESMNSAKIQVSYNKNFENAQSYTVKCAGKSSKNITLSKKNAKKVYVRVRLVAGTVNGPWSKVRTVVLK